MGDGALRRFSNDFACLNLAQIDLYGSICVYNTVGTCNWGL
jgi:hypothetical protein